MNIVLPKASYKPLQENLSFKDFKLTQVNSNGFNRDHYPIETLFKANPVENDLDALQSNSDSEESQNFIIKIINRFFRLIFVDWLGLG